MRSRGQGALQMVFLWLMLLLLLLLLACCARAKPQAIKPGCHYDGHRYLESEYVATVEPCLQCRCLDGSLRCRLRICPRVPQPVPRGCRVRPPAENTCCPEVVCGTDAVSEKDESANVLQSTKMVNQPSSRSDEGCLYEGVRYGPGSAMMGSRRCEYCYCISGSRRCIRPKCLLPLPGCTPLYAPHSCCPVAYNCTRQSSDFSTTHVSAISANECRTGQRVYQEGEMVRDIAWKAACDNCFCAMGSIRCVPLACAPPLQGCKPIVREGQCCPSTYNCSGTIQVKASQNYASYAFISKDYAKFRKETNFYPAIHDIALPSVEGRGHRVVNDALQAVAAIQEVITEKITSTATATESILTPETETMNNEILGETTEYPRHMTRDQEQPTNSITEISTSTDQDGPDQSTISTSEAATTATPTSRDVVSTTVVEEGEAGDASTEIPTTTMHSTSPSSPSSSSSSSLDVEGNVEKQEKADGAATITAAVVVTTIEEPVETRSTISVVSKNCSSGNETKSTSGSEVGGGPVASSLSLNALTTSTTTTTTTSRPEPSPSTTTTTITASSNSSSSAAPNSTKVATVSSSPGKKVGSDQTTEKIEPKNKPEGPSDDSTLANVTVKSNVAVEPGSSTTTSIEGEARPPDIEAILNITNRRKGEGEDYEYDYSEPTLPPSLPNVRIIPFVAADALVQDKEAGDGVPPAVTGYPASAVAVAPPDLSPKDTGGFYDIVTQENRFSPPKKTEGGFVPKKSPYFDSVFRPPNLSLEIGTGVTVAPEIVPPVINPHRKSDELLNNCLYEEHEYEHGEILPNRALCKICICYYGEIVCSDQKCPPLKVGCRRVLDPNDKCCSKIVCEKDEESPTVVLDRSNSTLSVRVDPTVSPNPFRDVIKTEPAPDLPSLIGDMMIQVDQPQQPETTGSTSITSTTLDSTEKTESPSPPASVNISSSTVETPTESGSEDDSVFSLDSVFDLFFSSDSDTTTVRPPDETPKSSSTAASTVESAVSKTTTPVLPASTSTPTTSTKKITTVKTTTTTTTTTTTARTTAKDISGGSLLKLAGCNIYGRMYQVGRIITELSNPCLECTCTEFGVQCKTARAC